MIYLSMFYYFIASIIGFIIFMMGPEACEQLVSKRMDICQKCDFKDNKGLPLYRIEGDIKHFCGKPWDLQKLRIPKRDGCGCDLKIKWTKRWASCPNNLW